METKPLSVSFPTLLPGIQVMVTNRVGNQTLQYQYIVYEYAIPSNEVTRTIGIHDDLPGAVQSAQNAACTIDELASALPPDGNW